MATFEDVLKKYTKKVPAKKEGDVHQIEKVRCKLMDVVDATGIDAQLLRGGKARACW